MARLTDRNTSGASGTRRSLARQSSGPSSLNPRRQTNYTPNASRVANRATMEARDALARLAQDNPILARRLASAIREGSGGGRDQIAAALRSADPVAEARRLLSTGQSDSPFGISGGGTPQFMDATAGGIAGRVLVLLQATESIGTSGTATIDADVAFSSTDQSRVGSVGRVMEELFVNVSVSGTMPTGYDADSLRQYLIGSTYVQPEIGGVPQLQIPLAAMINTNFIDRSFQMRALLDPGNFASFNFNWSSDALTPPAPGSGTWVAALQITAIFSEPLRKAA